MSVNIAGLEPIEDPEYRYKMPRLMAKIEGRGNGIKTVIVNCTDLALSLHRSPAEVTKYFGCELGAQSKYDTKTERATVNGSFDAADMQKQLCKYIELFVLCPNCRYPETKYKIKGGNIFHNCAACGAREMVDMSHKLCTFILKENEKDKKDRKKEGKKDKKERKKKKEKDTGSAEDGEESPSRKEKKSKKSKDKKEEKSKKKEEDEVEWETDLSEQAIAERAAQAKAVAGVAERVGAGEVPEHDEEEDVVATLDNLSIEDAEAIAGAVSIVQSYLREGSHSSPEITKEVLRVQTNAALPAKERANIFCQAAFTQDIVKKNEVERYSQVLRELAVSESEQLRLIWVLVAHCNIRFPELASATPVVLKLCYDEDVLDEDAIIAWFKGRVSAPAEFGLAEADVELVKKAVEPFINWLENAEEESDDE